MTTSSLPPLQSIIDPIDFIHYMERIWIGDLNSTHYHYWHNANKVARETGWIHSGNTVRDGCNAMVYRKSDECGIVVWNRGHACSISTNRRKSPNITKSKPEHHPMSSPTHADLFADIMASIWDTNAPNVYDKWSDANLVAQVSGAKQVSHYAGDDNNSATIKYLFPDGSVTTVIQSDTNVGTGVQSPQSCIFA